MGRNPQQFLETPSQLTPNLSFVLNLSPSAMTLGLENIRALLRELGDPQTQFRSVVVAGTNGKGSVTAFLSSILKANGQRVGWLSSPHVYSVNERICIDGEPVSVEVMEEAAARIAPMYDGIGYSYFEALTAIAFLVFASEGVETAVLETGLGGRLDATNIVDPELSIISSISLDHQRILGDTEEAILHEKLGVTRPRVPLIVGPLAPDLMKIVRQRAESEEIPLHVYGEVGVGEVTALTFDGMDARIHTSRKDYGIVRLPFMGEHQVANAVLAIAGAEILLESVDHLDRATSGTRLRGRFEMVTAGSKRFIFDVAHNDQALSVTTRTLASLSPPEKTAIVLGVLARKELRAFPEQIPDRFGRCYLVEPPSDNFCSAPLLLDRIGIDNVRDGCEFVLTRPFAGQEDMDSFIDSLLSPENPFEVFLCTGSHRTVEAFGRRFRERGLV